MNDQYSVYHSSTWDPKNRDGDNLQHSLQVRGFAKFSELLEELSRLDVDYDVQDLTFSGSISWIAPANQEMLDKRVLAKEASAKAHDDWERRTYLRLKEKYEPDDIEGEQQ